MCYFILSPFYIFAFKCHSLLDSLISPISTILYRYFFGKIFEIRRIVLNSSAYLSMLGKICKGMFVRGGHFIHDIFCKITSLSPPTQR